MVTWKALGILLLSIGCVGGLCFGFLMMLAGGMSDNPGAGEDASRQGLFLMAVGAICGGIAVLIWAVA